MAGFDVDRNSHSYLLGVAEHERDKFRTALEKITQRANESGTGEMGLIDTIHAIHRIASDALKPQDGGETAR